MAALVRTVTLGMTGPSIWQPERTQQESIFVHIWTKILNNDLSVKTCDCGKKLRKRQCKDKYFVNEICLTGKDGLNISFYLYFLLKRLNF